MDDPHAQRLQRLAIEALTHLRSWLWERHGALLPDDVAAVSREEAQRYAACLSWYSAIEDVLHTLHAAGPVPSAALLAGESLLPPTAPRMSGDEPPPTLRVTPAERPSSHSGVWHRTIAVEPSAARRAERSAA